MNDTAITWICICIIAIDWGFNMSDYIIKPRQQRAHKSENRIRHIEMLHLALKIAVNPTALNSDKWAERAHYHAVQLFREIMDNQEYMFDRSE